MGPGDQDWQPGQCLLTAKPGWVDEEVPGNDGAYWAPALASPRLLYYSGEVLDTTGHAHTHDNIAAVLEYMTILLLY